LIGALRKIKDFNYAFAIQLKTCPILILFDYFDGAIGVNLAHDLFLTKGEPDH